MKMLQKETRTAIEEYKEVYLEAHKICRNKRKEHEEEKLQSIQTYNTRSESFIRKLEDLKKDVNHNQQYAKIKKALW
jgi:hypothetical protein